MATHSIMDSSAALTNQNPLNRTNKELIGCRVIRGTDWKWGKQVKFSLPDHCET